MHKTNSWEIPVRLPPPPGPKTNNHLPKEVKDSLVNTEGLKISNTDALAMATYVLGEAEANKLSKEAWGVVARHLLEQVGASHEHYLRIIRISKDAAFFKHDKDLKGLHDSFLKLLEVTMELAERKYTRAPTSNTTKQE